MKKRIVFTLGMACLVTGCFTPVTVVEPRTWEPLPSQQDSSPMSWVRVLPTERAVSFKRVNFPFLSRMMRANMVVSAVQKKFNRTRLVLVDYGILPEIKPTKCSGPKYAQGKMFCESFIPKPERYFLTLSFYGGDQRPCAKPFYIGTAYLSVRSAPPNEAMRFMVSQIIDEYAYTKLSKLEVDLD